MKTQKLPMFLAICATSCSFAVNATPLLINTESSPHFYLQMENLSDNNADISFAKGRGDVTLDPVLTDHTQLPAHSDSQKYAVEFHPLLPWDTFNIVFTGNKSCTVNIAFYAPSDPKITISGYGCAGGGYKIIDSGTTLLLFISDIN